MAEDPGHIEPGRRGDQHDAHRAAEGTPGQSGVLANVVSTPNTQQFIAGGAAALVQDSNGKPCNGEHVFSSGDLIEDLTHNF